MDGMKGDVNARLLGNERRVGTPTGDGVLQETPRKDS